MYLIYKITNKANSKCYVGYTSKTVEERLRQHFKTSRNKVHYLVHDAILKHGESNFYIEALSTDLSFEKAMKQEKYWIWYFKSNDDTFGYNLTSGGDGVLGPTPETRRKMSEAGKRKVITEETKNKLRGRKMPPLSEATKLRMSLTKLGKKMKPEHAAKALANRTKIREDKIWLGIPLKPRPRHTEETKATFRRVWAERRAYRKEHGIPNKTPVRTVPREESTARANKTKKRTKETKVHESACNEALISHFSAILEFPNACP